jgi:hypothetical protein
VAVDHLDRLGLGLIEAVGIDVGGRHARRVVDDEDVVLPLRHRAVELKRHHRIDQRQHGQDLQQQQDVVAQPLKEGVDVQVLDALLPEERARHLQRLALN